MDNHYREPGLLEAGMGCQIEYGPGGTVFEREPYSCGLRKITACSSVNGQFRKGLAKPVLCEEPGNFGWYRVSLLSPHIGAGVFCVKI